MYENTSITFSKKNIIIAFDDIECDRTASFKIPATSKNDAALGLAKDFHFYGQAMRSRVSSQMVDGTVVKDGIFFVTGYEDGAYDCTFIYGENIALKTMKDRGGINTYLNSSSIIPDNITWSVSFDVAKKNIGMGVYYNYWTGEPNVMRSWRAPHPYAKFGYLLQKAATRLGVTLSNLPSAVDDMYFVLNGELMVTPGQVAVFGNPIYLYANLPSWTFVDMLKIVASLTGTLIIVENNVVRFFTYTSSLPKKDISGRVLKIGKMERKVGRFAQVNTIQYDKGDEMLASYGAVDPVVQQYEISNENIDPENLLYTLPNIVKPETLPQTDYDGVISSVKNRRYVYGQTPPYEVDYWEDEYLFVTADTITSGSQAGKIGLKSLDIPLGGGFYFLSQVFDSSTQLVVQAKLSHLEFEEIKPDMLIHLNGSDFIWIEMQYSNGVATLTLAKI